MQLFPAIWPEVPRLDASKPLPQCHGNEVPHEWRAQRIVVEFHGDGPMRSYWRDVFPRLPQLRLAYAGWAGKVVTTTVLREPTTLIRSAYKMWPPRVPVVPGAPPPESPVQRERGRDVAIVSFDTYLRSYYWDKVCGPLSRSLSHTDHHSNFTCTEEEVQLARRRLASFDVVGVTECTPRLWTALGARLAWPMFADGEILRLAMSNQNNDYYKPAEKNHAFRQFAEVSADSELGPSATAAYARGAQVDAELHADAMRMAGVLPPRSDADAADSVWLEASRKRPACGQPPGWINPPASPHGPAGE
jgi:hypothetical protein